MSRQRRRSNYPKLAYVTLDLVSCSYDNPLKVSRSIVHLIVPKRKNIKDGTRKINTEITVY